MILLCSVCSWLVDGRLRGCRCYSFDRNVLRVGVRSGLHEPLGCRRRPLDWTVLLYSRRETRTGWATLHLVVCAVFALLVLGGGHCIVTLYWLPLGLFALPILDGGPCLRAGCCVKK